MITRNWNELLGGRQAQGLMVCVGLDSDNTRIPSVVQSANEAFRIEMFNEAIVQATKDLVGAFKPNIAFYEALGPAGLMALGRTISFIHEQASGVPVIVDAKRADIGRTNIGYIRAIFNELGADAVTVNPYFGAEGLQPFLDQKDKGIIVLCRTSNQGAQEFQDLMVKVDIGEMPLYQVVAKRVANHWNTNGNCALVVGATYPKELAAIRQLVGNDRPLLIPGVGTQGGDVEKVVTAGTKNMIINSSSGVIFASNGPDFAEAARRSTLKLHQEIQAALAAVAQQGE